MNDLQLITFNPNPFFRTAVNEGRELDRRSAAKENGARTATSEHRLTTRGIGQMQVATALTFDVPFLVEPHYSNGFALVKNPTPNDWMDPVAFSGVRMWVRNSKGHYTGAYIYVRVQTEAVNASSPPATYPDVHIVHFASFTGLAYKDLGTAVTSAAITVKPRVPGCGANK